MTSKAIGIDARLYFQTGVGTYLRNLLHHLQYLQLRDLSFRIYMMPQDMGKAEFSNPKFIKVAAPFRWHSLTEQTGFFRQLMSDRLDLMHFTYFGYPILYHKSYIATIHDLTPLYFATGKASTGNPLAYHLKHAVFSHVIRSQVRNAKAVITPTQTVAEQIWREYGESYKSKIKAIYEGVNSELINIEENARLKDKFNFAFFIYVGNFYPHKNVENMVSAFGKVKTESRLLLLGPEDFFQKRLKSAVQNMGLSQKVLFYDSKSPTDLVFFYRHAQALIHPSLSEGFGLPVVEAMHFGLPIIASDIPVFRELMGKDCNYFNPLNVDDIAKKITDKLNDVEKKDYSGKLQNFSFKRMAEKTLDLYMHNMS